MRVIFLTHNYPRWSGDVAGGFLHPLAQALQARGVAIQVVAPSDRGQGGTDHLDGIPVERVRYGRPAQEYLAYTGRMQEALTTPGGWLRFSRLLRAMRSAVQRHATGGPTVVHAHWWLPAGLAAPAALPLVLTCHGTDVRLLQKIPGAALFAGPVFRRARVVTTVSTALAEVIQARIGRAIPPTARQPMPIPTLVRPRSIGGGGWVMVGRLTDQKRVDLAIRAHAIDHHQGGTSRLTIAGGGPAQAALEALAQAEGVADTVTFLGPLAPADVVTLLAGADVFLMPAREEGFGLAAAEALIQGVPVVGCLDGGGLHEIVTGGAGQLVAPTPEALCAAAQRLAGDAAARDAAATVGAAWQTRLAVDQVAERCLAWYRQALV